MEVDLMELFKMGVDFGQFLMEQERDSEDFVDAFQGFLIDEKYSMPSQPIPRRTPHSDQWRSSKIESFYKAMSIIGMPKKTENLYLSNNRIKS